MTDCWCAFSCSVSKQNGSFVSCIQSSSVQGYDGMHRSWEDIVSLEEQWPKTKTNWKESPYIEEDDDVSKNDRTAAAAKVTAELSIHPEDRFHKNNPTRASQI